MITQTQYSLIPKITGYYTPAGAPASPNFIFTIDTTKISAGGSTSTQFKLALRASRTYNCLIEWGDGNTTTQTTATSPTHTYSAPGIYQIQISGTFYGVNVASFNANDRLKWKSIDNWGTISLGQSQNAAFRGCVNLNILATDAPIFSTAGTNLTSFLAGCTSLNCDINHWNVENVSNFNTVFSGCTAFNSPLNNWNVSNATTTFQMFFFCGVFNQPLNNWSMQNCLNCSSMFEGCTSFNQDLSDWTLTSCTTIVRILAGCTSYNLPINWSLPACTDIGEMLQSCSLFNSAVTVTDLENCVSCIGAFSILTVFNNTVTLTGTQNILDWRGIFGLSPAFNQPVNFDTTNATGLSEFFNGCTAFNSSVTFSSTANCTTMASMFVNCTNFNQSVNSFNVTNVIDFSSMFGNCTNYNQPMNSWVLSSDPSGVLLSGMFSNCTAFNQDISAWSAANIADASGFMDGKTNLDYSTANYNALLNSWSTTASLTWAPTLDMGTIKYTAAGAAARATLIGTYGWTINDGGL